jgi:hypothetical protein
MAKSQQQGKLMELREDRELKEVLKERYQNKLRAKSQIIM